MVGEIPLFHNEWTLDEWIGDPAALAIGRAWVAGDPPPSLVLVGAYGTGKTSLAVTLLQERCRRETRPPERCFFITAADLLDHLRVRERAASDLLATVKTVDLLALDDLGAELGSPTPPLEIVCLEDRVGERTVQRLIDRDAYQIVALHGPNLRLAGGVGPR